MKKIECYGISYCISLWCLCQSNEDSILLAHSERWKVQQHKGLFGLSKPEFGADRTLEAIRFDSSVIKKKTKESSSIDIESSSEETDIDHSKFLTVKKTKFYRLLLGSNTDTTEAVFSISSVSKEKKQTFLGKIISKD